MGSLFSNTHLVKNSMNVRRVRSAIAPYLSLPQVNVTSSSSYNSDISSEYSPSTGTTASNSSKLQDGLLGTLRTFLLNLIRGIFRPEHPGNVVINSLS